MLFQLLLFLCQIHKKDFYRLKNFVSLKTDLIILSFGSLTTEPNKDERSPKRISFLSPRETGLARGNLLGYGDSSNLERSTDQREDDGRPLTFDPFLLTDDFG